MSSYIVAGSADNEATTQVKYFTITKIFSSPFKTQIG